MSKLFFYKTSTRGEDAWSETMGRGAVTMLYDMTSERVQERAAIAIAKV